MSKNKLIVIEGACDGVGKSTQFELLKDKLISDGHTIESHHFPSYGTIQGSLVEMYLKGELGDLKNLSPYFINGLYAMDRAITWNKDLKISFNKGNTILLDRYTTSSLIYQSALIENLEEKKKFVNFTIDYEYNKVGIKSPDQVIFLYAPFELIQAIRSKRNKDNNIEEDIHEKDLIFMKKVYDNACFLADYLKWDKVICNNGNSFRSIEEIHEDIYKLVSKKKKN